jgi:hypothetical protein
MTEITNKKELGPLGIIVIGIVGIVTTIVCLILVVFVSSMNLSIKNHRGGGYQAFSHHSFNQPTHVVNVRTCGGLAPSSSLSLTKLDMVIPPGLRGYGGAF